jgi:hypothetical protein
VQVVLGRAGGEHWNRIAQAQGSALDSTFEQGFKEFRFPPPPLPGRVQQCQFDESKIQVHPWIMKQDESNTTGFSSSISTAYH